MSTLPQLAAAVQWISSGTTQAVHYAFETAEDPWCTRRLWYSELYSLEEELPFSATSQA